jgi:hypothetical protein
VDLVRTDWIAAVENASANSLIGWVFIGAQMFARRLAKQNLALARQAKTTEMHVQKKASNATLYVCLAREDLMFNAVGDSASA